MKYKIIITTLLFIFSILLIKNGVYFIRENDILMKILKDKQDDYYIKPVDAIITEHIMIPGISGRKVNLEKSYQKMKSINEFKESLLVFDDIKPNKSINNHFDKIIISGNQNINKISIVTKNDDNYCFISSLDINNTCNDKPNIFIEKIINNHLNTIKEKVHNGIIFYLENINTNELSLIYKYLRNNNYDVVSIDELIKE